MKAMFLENNKKHGFTLVELVLVIVILGVLAAVTLPKFFTQSTFDERYFYDDLISASRYAQRLATGSGCIVRLNVSAGGFSLVQDSNCNSGAPSYNLAVARPAASEAYSNNDVPMSMTITTDEPAYYFLPEGAVTDGAGANVGNASIVLTSSIIRTINIIGTTGYSFGT